jgi:hypothetical protein
MYFETINSYKDTKNIINKMNNEDKKLERIKKNLDKLIENAKTYEDADNIRILIDDYSEEGYRLSDYIVKYNKLIQKFCNEETKNN